MCFQNKSQAFQTILKDLSLSYEVDLGLICVHTNDNVSKEAQNFSQKPIWGKIPRNATVLVKRTSK